ncbi:MAG: signal peptide peptidase SppA [Vicinamibacteria bacterium]
MSEKRSFLGMLLRAFDALRRLVVNLVFFGLLAALVVAAWSARPKVPAGAALVLRPQGTIVEEVAGGGPLERLAAERAGAGARETLLRDLLDAVRLAKDDARIKVLFLDLDAMSGAGLTKLRDLGAVIAEFRKSGKKVVAYADSYAQGPYYLAAQADEVYLHPQGMVLLEGYGRWRNYYKEGLDRFGVSVHVFRVGEYKSAVEPYLRDDMSPEAREMSLDAYGDLWRDYLGDVAKARKLQPADVQALVDGLPDRLRAAGGDMARLAKEARLVDTVAPRDAVRQRLIALVGAEDDGRTFRQVDQQAYLVARAGDRRRGAARGDAVAVVVAKGDILDGRQPAGTVGGDSTSRLIRRAREDASVKAIVLRVDSPGGSAFASEVIRRECELARGAGKPVVVSMGSLAASGGYWISTASDEIWAQPETITGSIGIFGVFPTVERPLAKYLGIHTDGVGTTRFSDALRPDRALDPAVADVIQQSIDHGYEEFLAHVAKARKMTRDQVDRIARGRVWSGEDAKTIGLVDQLGGLDQAIESAGRKAKLPPGHRVFYVEPEKSFRDRLSEALFARAASVLGGPDELEPGAAAAPRIGPVEGVLRGVQADLERLARWNDPGGAYAHCLCGED